MYMYCRYCGNQKKEGDLYCSKCGKYIDDTNVNIVTENLGQKVEKHEHTDSSPAADLEEVFVGNNYDYYIEKWDKIEEKNKKISWNWASFFLGPLWFGYRKMYIPILLITLAYLIIDLLLYVSDNSPALIAAPFIIPICLGLLGNYIYLKHTNKYIVKSGLLPLNDEHKKIWLKGKGGTSWLGLLLTVCILIGSAIISSFLFPSDSDKILAVKDGSFYDYPTITIGEQFDIFFDEPNWEYSDSPYEIVEFTGFREIDGTAVYITINFILTDGSFEIHSASFDNKELTDEEINSLLDAVFSDENIESNP